MENKQSIHGWIAQKDKIGLIIAAWKISDKVERTRGGNPKPPKLDTIINWVAAAWNQVNKSVILNSIKAAGFGNETELHIYKHDVYGVAFRIAWLSRISEPLLNTMTIQPVWSQGKIG